MTKRFPKLKDVAIAAGVSTATVSRALSEPDRVSADTRAIVFQAVEQTGYRINHAARNLRRRQAGGIVVLVPNLANPFFSQILSGITAAMATSGYNVLIADTQHTGEASNGIAEYLHNNRADGLIVLDANLPENVLSARDTPPHHPPIVFACEWLEEDPRPTVTIDNFEGTRLVIAHLAGLGHRRIGHLTGPPDNVLTLARANGSRTALAEHGLDIRDDWFFEGDFSLASGAAAADRWLALSDRPTAMFCASDAMACGFIGALHQKGVRVPDQLSVVGFDDIEIAAHFVPSLTTVAQPRALIGETAARTLLALIGNGRDETTAVPLSQTLPVRLVTRQSSAPPR